MLWEGFKPKTSAKFWFGFLYLWMNLFGNCFAIPLFFQHFPAKQVPAKESTSFRPHHQLDLDS